MQAGEQNAAHDLVARGFDAFVGPDCSAEGRQEFFQYVHPDALLERSRTGHLTLLALLHGELAGVIEMRDHDHVSLLFVEPRFHRRGIARGLLQQAVEQCLMAKPDLQHVSVHSSLYATRAYERLGFQRTGPIEVRRGISFVPMDLAVR